MAVPAALPTTAFHLYAKCINYFSIFYNATAGQHLNLLTQRFWRCYQLCGIYL